MEPETSKPGFFIGQIVEHKKYGYRGVIFGVDPEFGLSEQWYEQVAQSRPPKDKPWYHVLVDQQLQTTYVAERHLGVSKNVTQIEHPYLGEYFASFTGTRYLPNQTVH